MPIFFGALGSLLLCALIAFDSNVYQKAVININSPQVKIVRYHDEDANLLFAKSEEIEDPVLTYFRNPDYRDWVLDFFTSLCSDREIARAILDHADRFNVSPSLAFALSWEESRFNPRAINRYNRDGSMDRGLFQLNSRSFPHLDNFSVFDVRTNSYYGLSHLRFCLDTGGTEVSALAMYNAGAGRVRTTGAPEITLNYISRILDNRVKIETRFLTRLLNEEEIRLAEMEENEVHPSSRTLTATSPW
jgi:hypothetical protein